MLQETWKTADDWFQP
ncbi:hypothetical protein [Serratia ureilytica]